MRKIIVLLLALLISLGLTSCEENVSSSSQGSTSQVSSSTSSSEEVKTYSTTLSTSNFVNFEQVGDLDLSELVEGDVVKFKLKAASGTKGDLVCVVNGETLVADSEGVYSYTVGSADLELVCSGISLLANDLLVFTANDAVNFVSVDESELPSELTEGDSVSFKVEVKEDTKGTLVVKLGDTVLTADENGVYSCTAEDIDLVVTVSGVALLADDLLTFEENPAASFVSLDESVLPSSLKEGDTVSFKVEVKDDTKGTAVVKVGEEILTADEDGVYSYVAKEDDISFVISGVTLLADDTISFVANDAASFVSVDESELPTVLKEGQTVSFKLSVEEHTTGTPVVKIGEVVLTADEDGVYSYVLEVSDVEFAVSEVRLLDVYNVSVQDSDRYVLTDEDGVELSSVCYEGDTVSFQVSVVSGYSSFDKVFVGDVELTADEDGVYTYIPSDDFSVEATGVKKEVAVDSITSMNLSVEYSEDYSNALEGDTIKFKVIAPSFNTVSDVVVMSGDTELTADEDGVYSVVAGVEDISIAVDGSSVVDVSSVVLNGEGTADSPYEVSSAVELIKFSALYSETHSDASGYDESTFVELTSDIDMESYGLVPISGYYGFYGDFNGNGHVISNFNVDPTGGRGAGLFYITNNAAIYNFTIDADMDVSNMALDFAGSVAVMNFASSFSGIIVRGDIVANAYGMGGLVGIDRSGSDDGSVIYEGNDVEANIVNLRSNGSTAGLVGIADSTPYGETYGAQLLLKNNRVSGMITGNYVISGLSTSIAENSTVTGNYVDAVLYSLASDYHYISGIVGFDAESGSTTNRFLINNVFAGDMVFVDAEGLSGGVGSMFATVVDKDTYYLESISFAPLASVTEKSATAEEIANNVMGLDTDVWNFTEEGVSLKNYADYHAAKGIQNYEAVFTLNTEEAGEFDSVVVSQLSRSFIALPTPAAEGLVFEGWYIDSELTVPYDINMVFTQDTTLYAKWRVAVDYSLYAGEYEVAISDETTAYISIDSEGIVLYYIPGETVAQLLPQVTEGSLLFTDGYTSLSLNVAEDNSLSLTVGDEDVQLTLVTDDSFPVIDGALFIETFAGNYEYYEAMYDFTFSVIITPATDTEEGSIYIDDCGGDTGVASSITVTNGMFKFVGPYYDFYFTYMGNGSIHVLENSDYYGVYEYDYVLAAPEAPAVLEDFYGVYHDNSEDSPFGSNYIELNTEVLVNGVVDETASFVENEDGSFVLTYNENTYVVSMNNGDVMFADSNVTTVSFSSMSDYEGIYEVTNVASSKVSYVSVDADGNISWGNDVAVGELSYFGTLEFSLNDVNYSLDKSGYSDFELVEVSETPVNTYTVVEFDLVEATEYVGYYRDSNADQLVLTENELHYLSYESYDVVAEPGKLVVTTLEGDVLTFVLTDSGVDMTGILVDGTTEVTPMSFYKTHEFVTENFVEFVQVEDRVLFGFVDEMGVVQVTLDDVLGVIVIENNEVVLTFGDDVITVKNTGTEGDSVISLNDVVVTNFEVAEKDFDEFDGLYKDELEETFVSVDSENTLFVVDDSEYSFVEFEDAAYLYHLSDNVIVYDYTVSMESNVLTLTSVEDSSVHTFMGYSDTSSLAGSYYVDFDGDTVKDEVVVDDFGKLTVLDSVGVVTVSSEGMSVVIDDNTYVLVSSPSTGTMTLSKEGSEDLVLETFASLVLDKVYTAEVDGHELRFEFGYTSRAGVMYVVADTEMLLLTSIDQFSGSAEYNGVVYTFTLDVDGNLNVTRVSDGLAEDTVVVSLDLNKVLQMELLGTRP